MSAGKVLAAAVGLIGMALMDEQAERRRFFRLQFDKFHEAIKHDEGDERQMLRQKRELLCQELRDRLPVDLKPTFFDQGSYAMQTGIVPIDGDFDIDVGLVFECGPARFDSPVHAKSIVRDALAFGARKVQIRRSCVTVQYSRQGEFHHHVDIAIYARAKDGQLLLAKGKEHSKKQLVFWEPSHPLRLLKLIRERYEGQKQSQFRRCIRYLKYWKLQHFGTPAPHSIALTAAAVQWFSPELSLWSSKPNDIQALAGLVQRMLTAFSERPGSTIKRLSIPLPTLTSHDLLGEMTDEQMQVFHDKLTALHEHLTGALKEKDKPTANELLRLAFGEKFPESKGP